jgi:hypothetical protein
MAKTHCVIPDVQAKPGIDFAYLTRIGRYLVEKKPDVIVQIGDFADMPSLSSYDIGKKSFEGRRYRDDILAAHAAMEALLRPIKEYNAHAVKNHKPRYYPRKVLTLGNHENRINRAVNDDPKLDGVLSVSDLKYEEYGWEVHPFLDVVSIDNIAYSHYFTSGAMGRPVSSPAMLLAKKHDSCIMGHVQNRGIAYSQRADGREIKGLFCGSCYEHDEDYLGPQGNHYWRGIWMLHNVDDGEYDEMPVPLDYLKAKYVS